MKLYAPQYYQKFTCIADRCRHSCCVGWEIDVDEDTLARYQALTGDYAKKIRQSIDHSETPHFRLLSNERCPHLDERGLCRIITNFGEECLCDICREHPRFYHKTAHGMEVGLGMACEEACRLILASDDYKTMVELDTLDGKTEPQGFDALPHRRHIYDILSNEALPYEERVQRIAQDHHISLGDRSDGQWRELLGSLEYLDEAHRPLLATYTSRPQPPKDAKKHLERALAYFVFRHCSAATSESDLRAALGLALFCERLLASVITATACDTAEAARILSEELEYSEENTEAIKEMFH